MHRPLILLTLLMVSLITPAAFAGWGGPVSVEVDEVREEILGASLYLTGDLQSLHRSVIGSEVEGRVAEVFVDEGTAVAQGDPIIRLDTRLLELQVNRDEARLEAARARLARLQTGSRPQEISQARAELAENRAMLVNAQVEYDSQRPLRDQGVISPTEFAGVEADYEAARAQVEYAEARLQLAQEGFRVEEISESQAEVAELTAELELTRENLTRATVRAPFDGVIARVYTEVGEWMQIGSDVVYLVDTTHLEVILEVPEMSIANVQIGQRGTIEVDALPGVVIDGELSSIEPLADLTNRTYSAHVRVLEPPATLMPGMFTRVALETSDPTPVLIMSSNALVDRGRGPEVWLLSEGLEGPMANPQRIEIGRRRGDNIEVLSGLSPGDQVVTAGTEFLIPGAPVMPVGAEQPAGDAPAASGEDGN